MSRRILVPVGRGGASRAALDDALRLARRSGGVLGLIHVADQVLTSAEAPDFVGTPGELIDLVTRAGARLLRDAWAVVRRQDVECCPVLCDQADGAVAEQVTRHAVHWGADLVVLGVDARGTSRIAHEIRQLVRAPLMTVRWRPALEAAAG